MPRPLQTPPLVPDSPHNSHSLLAIPDSHATPPVNNNFALPLSPNARLPYFGHGAVLRFSKCAQHATRAKI